MTTGININMSVRKVPFTHSHCARSFTGGRSTQVVFCVCVSQSIYLAGKNWKAVEKTKIATKKEELKGRKERTARLPEGRE